MRYTHKTDSHVWRTSEISPGRTYHNRFLLWIVFTGIASPKLRWNLDVFPLERVTIGVFQLSVRVEGCYHRSEVLHLTGDSAIVVLSSACTKHGHYAMNFEVTQTHLNPKYTHERYGLVLAIPRLLHHSILLRTSFTGWSRQAPQSRTNKGKRTRSIEIIQPRQKRSTSYLDFHQVRHTRMWMLFWRTDLVCIRSYWNLANADFPQYLYVNWSIYKLWARISICFHSTTWFADLLVMGSTEQIFAIVSFHCQLFKHPLLLVRIVCHVYTGRW